MDILSSDLLMSFFASALNGYKHDSLVRPFPSHFMKNDEKDFEVLTSTFENVPPFYEIDWKDTKDLDQKAVDLVKWVITPKKFKLTKVLTKKFHTINELCGEKEDRTSCKPDFVFEVLYNQEEEDKFMKLCGDKEIIHAYHGSKAENFYSILHHGLRNNMTKASLFGEGIYLSSDLRVCQSYSPTCHTWNSSLLGSSLSCIAVCQIVDHPDVKCSVKRSSQLFSPADGEVGSSKVRLRHKDSSSETKNSKENVTEGSAKQNVKVETTSKDRSFIRGSEGGEIPDKYYVVRNDDLVRVKYLYVYAPNAQRGRIAELFSGAGRTPKAEPNALQAFISRHQFFLVMLLYVLILGCISLWNSKVISKWWQKIVKSPEEDSAFLP